MNFALLFIDLSQENLLQQLQKMGNLFVISENPKDWFKEKEGYKYISYNKAIRMYKEKNIDKFIVFSILKKNMNFYYETVLKVNINPQDIYYIPFYNTFFQQFDNRSDLDFLSIHIMENCNLKCAHCSSMSGLVHNPHKISYKKVEDSIKILKKMYTSIVHIQLIGGEPLLNDEITKYCVLLRNTFPYSFIEIITNGTLILNLNNEFFKTCYKYNIALSISYYPILSCYIDDINFILSKNKIMYNISEKITSFEKYYNFSGKSDLNQTYTNCQSVQYCKNGLTLYEDMLFPCVAPITLKRANIIHDSNKYGIKVSNYLSKNEIKSLFQPMEICKYCHIDQLQKWKQLNISEIHDIENWSV